jgi:hypothetical protein
MESARMNARWAQPKVIFTRYTERTICPTLRWLLLRWLLLRWLLKKKPQEPIILDVNLGSLLDTELMRASAVE